MRLDERGAQVWLDGRYATRFDSAARATSLTLVLPAHASLRDERISTEPFSGKFLALGVRHIANPGALADAKISLAGKPAGAHVLGGIPLLVADGPGNADTGVCRENLGSFYLECDGYLARTPFDGMPESLLFSVPVAQYRRAWLLCAVEDDADKVPIVTARLTKFPPGSHVGRGPAIADTVVTLPRLGEPLPPGVTQVGEIKTGGKTLPLYLVECKIDSGSIQEIIFSGETRVAGFRGARQAQRQGQLLRGPLAQALGRPQRCPRFRRHARAFARGNARHARGLRQHLSTRRAARDDRHAPCPRADGCPARVDRARRSRQGTGAGRADDFVPAGGRGGAVAHSLRAARPRLVSRGFHPHRRGQFRTARAHRELRVDSRGRTAGWLRVAVLHVEFRRRAREHQRHRGERAVAVEVRHSPHTRRERDRRRAVETFARTNPPPRVALPREGAARKH